jgi:hypothetical protein
MAIDPLGGEAPPGEAVSIAIHTAVAAKVSGLYRLQAGEGMIEAVELSIAVRYPANRERIGDYFSHFIQALESAPLAPDP